MRKNLSRAPPRDHWTYWKGEYHSLSRTNITLSVWSRPRSFTNKNEHLYDQWTFM